MRFNSSKAVILVGTLLLLSANSAFATYNYYKPKTHSSKCGSTSGGTTGGSSPTTPTTPSICDSWAGTLNYDMYNEQTNTSNVDYGYSTSGSQVSVNGIGVEVSAWSDTGNYNGNYSYRGQTADGSGWYGEQDATIEEATVSHGDNWRYGVSNADAYDSHHIDNLTSDYGETDYDMVLFSFSEEVALDGATFSWLYGAANTQQVSVVGLNDISALTSGDATWSSISNSVTDSGLKGSFQIELCENVYVSSFTELTGTAQYWLVGAYNTVFGHVTDGSKNNDGFKLASLGISKLDDNDDSGEPVNAPGSFAFLALTGAFIGWRRKQK